MNRAIVVVFMLLVCSANLYAQSRDRADNPWIIGLYLNSVNNSGEAIQEPFKFKENYLFSLPFKLSVEKRVYDDFGLQAAVTFNTAKEGQTFANMIAIEQSMSYIGVDLTLKYYFTNMFIRPTSKWEGYIFIGPGVAFFDDIPATILNLGGGTNFQITDEFRLVLQASAKRTISKYPKGASHLQYDFGCIYRLPW